MRTRGAVAQLGERRLCKAEVVGSNPISSTKGVRVVWQQVTQVGGGQQSLAQAEIVGMHGSESTQGS